MKKIVVGLSLTPEQNKNVADLQKAIYKALGCKLTKKETYLFGLRTLADKFGLEWSGY